MMHPICFFRWAWRSFRCGANFSGHDFTEIKSPPGTQILKCMVCGEESVGWTNRQGGGTDG